ncbi:unnamed protein product, partial [Iphiclides podalirius]
MNIKREAFERHFCFLAAYDEYPNSDVSLQMESICLLNMFTSHCNETLQNLCCQVFAVVSEGLINLNGIQLHFIINNIGELFTIIILLELLISRTSLATNWNNYCKYLKATSPENMGTDKDKFNAILGAIDNITSKIMCDDLVQNTLQQLLVQRKNNLVEKNCTVVSMEFSQYIKQAIINLDKLVQQKPNTENMYKCIKVNALFVLNSHLFGSGDKKIFKALIDVNSKAHSIHIVGTTVWFPEQFLQRHAPSLVSSHSKLSQTMLKNRQAFMNAKKLSLSKDIAVLQNVCSQWILNVESIFSNNNKLNAAEMSLHAKIILEGLEITSTINHSLLTFLNLHSSLGIPLSKQTLMSLFEIIDLLKNIKNAITRNHNQILNSVTMIVQHLLFQAASSIQEVKKMLMCDKKYANKKLDELTCIVIAEQAIKGAATIERNTATNIALSFIPEATYVNDTYVKLGTLLERVQTLTNFLNNMDKYCNCSWMLSHQNVIPIYFEQLFCVDLNAPRLKQFFMVLEDCAALLHKTDQYYGNTKHCCSDATAFLPNLVNKSFKELCEENCLGEKLIEAAENLDDNISGLVSNFIEGTEYFKLLVDVFAPVFRNPKNVHLKNFFIIVPPLTLNFIEHMILSKDKMSKKNKAGAAFTDDGFAVGVAYILKLLDQDPSFESLHWFNAVWDHIKEERERINEQKTQGTLQLQQALALSEKKIKTLEEEFRLLYYSLTSARIFFR